MEAVAVAIAAVNSTDCRSFQFGPSQNWVKAWGVLQMLIAHCLGITVEICPEGLYGRV